MNILPRTLRLSRSRGLPSVTWRLLGSLTKQSSDKKLPFVAAFRDSVDGSPKNDSDLIAETLFTDSDEAAVKAFKASPAMEAWPTFATKKQIKATGKDVLCLPWDEISQTRRRDVMNALRGVEGSGDEVHVDPDCERNVVLVGAAGIGKSTEMNYYLREFVRHMGEESWPRTVLYRCPRQVIIVQLNNKHLIESKAMKKMTLDELDTWIDSQGEDKIKDAILLLELGEFENDPMFSCRTLVSLSARDAKTVAKTMDKSGARFFIVNPPSPQQMELMAKAVLQLSNGKEQLLKNLGVKEGEAEALEVVRERVEQVGPLPRVVFGDAVDFEARLSAMRSPRGALFSELINAEIFDVPPQAKFFVAPFVRSDAPSSLFGKQTPDGQEIAQLSFLCDRAARLVANAVDEARNLKILSQGYFDYQIAEIFMRDALMNLDKRSSWDVHEDVGPDKELTVSSRLENEEQTRYKNGTMIPVMKFKDHFRGKYCTKKVSEMHEHTLYWSLSHNMAVCECLAVDHEKKIVFAFQSTALDPSQHAFNASTVMEHIGMNEPKHKDYKLKIVVFADMSREKTHGCAFNYDLKGGVKVKKLDEQRKDTVPSGANEVSVGGGSSSVGGKKKKNEGSSVDGTDEKSSGVVANKPKGRPKGGGGKEGSSHVSASGGSSSAGGEEKKNEGSSVTSKLSLKAFIEMTEKDKTPLLC